MLGTGAFSSVEADRTASVQVAGDASALLQIERASAKSKYVDSSGGTIAIDINEVNRNAVTVINPILKVTNNGPNPVEIGFNDELVEQRESFDPGIQPATHVGDEEAFLILWGPYDDGETADPITKEQVNTSGFTGPNGSGVINNQFGYDFAGSDARTADTGETLELGATVDTRDEIINGGIPRKLDNNISLLAERSENGE